MSSFKTFERKAGRLMGNMVQKGSGMVETGKIRVSINREERAVDELFYKIGEAVYDNCMRNGVTPDYIASECKEVEERRVKIAKLNAKLSMARAATEDMDSKKGKQEKEVIIDITVDDKKEKTE
jgi:hypothetical protein